MATPEQERNLALAKDGLEAWVAGDVERTLSTLTEDIEVFVPSDLGNAGTYRGHDGFRQWTASWDEAWSEFSYEIESIEAVGERHVLAVLMTRGVGRGSGIEVENALAYLIAVRDGRCEYLSLQPGREQAIELARSREGF